MSTAQYIVNTRVKSGIDPKTKKPIYVLQGMAVTLTEEEAAPLLACRAIRIPDVLPPAVPAEAKK